MKILIPDKVSETAAKVFKENEFIVEQKSGITIEECNNMAKDADAIVVRSYKLHELEFNEDIKVIGRAGAGVNNIPIDKCTEKGIVVFNTPGANANAVKELVLCGLLLSSRKIVKGVNWTTDQKEFGEEVPKLVEKNKKEFKGIEIKGKTLGVIGLGSIGMLVANDASALGMNVIGYDPYLSIDTAWKLSRDIKNAKDMESLIKESDYISLHIPLNENTKHIINKEKFAIMKKGVKIMNFSRDALVNTKDLIDALNDGVVNTYVTDFPKSDQINVENIICIPHLGASTQEAEENCAVMISDQITDFLKNGNIKNSVNFPNCKLERNIGTRITIVNKNVPSMIGKITAILAETDINIENMINKNKGDIAYNIFEVMGEISENAIEKFKKIEGVFKVRIL